MVIEYFSSRSGGVYGQEMPLWENVLHHLISPAEFLVSMLFVVRERGCCFLLLAEFGTGGNRFWQSPVSVLAWSFPSVVGIGIWLDKRQPRKKHVGISSVLSFGNNAV